MRKVIDMQMKIGELDIKNIEFDLRSRDEIPELLMGLQSIYCDREVRDRVFEVLPDIVPDDVDPNNGRSGMNFYGKYWFWAHCVYPAIGITIS